MSFLDFIASVKGDTTLDAIHHLMKVHLCTNYNVQCMMNDDEYFKELSLRQKEMYVIEVEAGVYEVLHLGALIVKLDFIKGTIKSALIKHN